MHQKDVQMWTILLVFSVAFNLCLVEADRPLINTKLGQLEGVWLNSANGLKYAGFMGIPYAKPPIGELRFEPPEKIEPWEGIWDAGDYGPFCLSYDHVFGLIDRDPIGGQEDCLYLNIFTPKIPKTSVKETELLDVIFYIHGGAYMFGRSNFFGAKYLMDRNVILVTMNYRLGPLGFLSFEDEVLPGNNGLRDQLMALKWINKHISEFGGNPKSVTLMGLSAGGASVHYHFLSPLSKGLHKNGISMSGTATCPWALVDNARERGLQLAKSVGCSVEKGTEHIVECLKQRPAEKLVKTVEQFQVWQYSPFSPFGPVIEHTPSPKYKPFLNEAPFDLMMSGRQRRLPWMLGIVDAEGLYPVASFIADEAELKKLDEEFDDLVPHLLDYHHTVHETDRLTVTTKIRNEYFGDKKVSKDTTKELIKMASDRLFVLDAQKAAEIQGQFAPVYFYKMSRRPSKSYSDLMSGTTNNYGTSHVDDLFYLMNLTFYEDYQRTGSEKGFMEMILDLFTSFADINDMMPVSEGVDWKWVNVDDEFNYLNLDGRVPAEMAHDNDMGNAEFWTSLPIKEGTQRTAQKRLYLIDKEKMELVNNEL